MVVGVEGGGLVVVERESPGLKIQGLEGLDRTRSLSRVEFDGVPCTVLSTKPQLAEETLAVGYVALAADGFGAATRLLDATVEYAKTREQFGQSIAQFQAVKHQIARLGLEIEPTRALWWHAAYAVDHLPDHAERLPALAKSHVGDRAAALARMAVELHGGLGFTWECDVQIWLKRILFDRGYLGSPESLREDCARLGGVVVMDLEYGPAYQAYREEVRNFLKGWPLKGAESELSQSEQESLFRLRGIEAGFVYRNMPREYGGAGQEPDALKDQIVLEEFHRANAPGDLRSQGAGLLAPTLLEFGTEAQKQRFIPAALSGEEAWCQGYSEPGSGSDLASLTCQGRVEGDSFILTGQKIWTSNANAADWMFGLFRTEPEKPKHAGISYLLVDMRSAGIDVRPLKTLTGGLSSTRFFSMKFESRWRISWGGAVRAGGFPGRP